LLRRCRAAVSELASAGVNAPQVGSGAVVIVCAALMMSSASAPARAAEFVNRPVRIVVGFPPGGAADTTARMISSPLSGALAQPVVVENRVGASGNIASSVVAKAAPDGSTLLLGTIATLAVNPSVFRTLPFDPVNDFTPLTLATVSSNVLVVHPSLPVKNVRDLIALARARPMELTMAASGRGTAGHLAGVLFDLMAKTRIMPVIYNGGGPTVLAVVTGEVQLAFPTIDAALGQINAHRLRALAVTGKARTPVLPALPTVAESGLPGYEAYNWYGVVMPAKAAPAIVERLNAELVKILKNPEVSGVLLRQALETRPTTPEEFRAYIRSETSKWKKVVNTAGIDPQ
jgi:tripartite-type tricarboxylate transporter receptor subunit TctC